MCNTVPKVVAKLGHDKFTGFTKKELIAAFLADGYGIDKAERHALKLILGGGVIESPENPEDAPKDQIRYISVYCPWHYEYYYSVLKDVEVTPVKIERDGRVTKFT